MGAMEMPEQTPPEPDTLIERALGPVTWVVAIFALLVVIGFLIFVVFGFFGGEEESVGLRLVWGI
jgi:hypothetical protein